MEVLPMVNTYAEIIRQFHQSVRDAIVSRPDLSYAQIAKQFGVSEVTVYTIAAEFGVGRIKTGPKPGWLKNAEVKVL
jgi:transposase